MDPIRDLRRLPSSGLIGRTVRKATDEARQRAQLPRSRRLTFVYDAEGLRLVSHANRMKPAPPSDAVDEPVPARSVVAELRSGRGEVLYRKRIPRAFPTEAEVPEPDGSMRRVSYQPTHGTMSVIVPVRGKGTRVAVIAGSDTPIDAVQPEARAARPSEPALLGLFPMDNLPGPGGL